MREAVIVSYARTGLAKSNRGGFNNTHGAAMAGHAIQHAVQRAKLDGPEVEDVVLGCGGPEGATDLAQGPGDELELARPRAAPGQARGLVDVGRDLAAEDGEEGARERRLRRHGHHAQPLRTTPTS